MRLDINMVREQREQEAVKNHQQSIHINTPTTYFHTETSSTVTKQKSCPWQCCGGVCLDLMEGGRGRWGGHERGAMQCIQGLGECFFACDTMMFKGVRFCR